MTTETAGATKAATVAKMTITLPTDLKLRIDAAAEVNWSGIAATAYRMKLTELQANSEPNTLDEALARLRAGIRMESNEDFADGQEAGRAWAMKAAKPKHLRRLTAAVVDIDNMPEEERVASLVGIMEPNEENEIDRDTLQVQLDGYISATQAESSDYVGGFVRGATDVWEQL